MMEEAASFDTQGRVEPWAYEQLEVGLNARMDEMSAALALSQLGKLPRFVRRRARLAELYDAALAPLHPRIEPVPRGQGAPGFHLYTLAIADPDLRRRRGAIMRSLAAEGIGTQVHYIPLHRQPALKARLGEVRLPGAQAWFERTLSLPLHPSMTDEDVGRVTDALARAVEA